MRNLALLGFAACLLIAPAAAAQTRFNAPGRIETAPGTGTAHLPLDAMLHHQPRAGDVARREGAPGVDEAQEQKRRQAELDALYNDIMRRSAPKQ
jgi:hypothetical protein